MSNNDPLHLMQHEPGTVDPIPMRVTVAERNGVVVPLVELSAHLQRCANCRARYAMYVIRAISNVCDEIETAEGTVIERTAPELSSEPISANAPTVDDIFSGLGFGDTKAN